MIKLTTVALTCLLSCGSMTTVTATITYNDPLDADAGGGTTTNSNRLRGIRSSSQRPQEQEQDATAMNNNNIKLDQEQEEAAADEAAANYFLRGIRSSDPEESQESQPTNPQEEVEPASSMILSPQEAPPIGSTKPKIRTKTKQQSSHQPQQSQLTSLQTFAQNMLTNQGCPPTTTTSCGDICYVLTPAAASDLHSVAIGHSSTPTHHWHDPTSFWQTGVCNAKSQCVSVNPFDRGHDFVDLTNTLAEVERECERNVGMGTMFVLAKAMEPPSWVKGGGGNKRR